MNKADSESQTSRISTESIKQILLKLQNQKNRSSTRSVYFSVWRKFNKFVVRLDKIPETWEERTSLYVGFLAGAGKKSSTIKSYISGIKSILEDDGYEWSDKDFKMTSLTKACRLVNDQVRTRLPIKHRLLEVILDKLDDFYTKRSQHYLKLMYQCIFLLAYYGLLRIGEMATGSHPFKARDIHISYDKKKIMIVLFSSKTHGKESNPQQIKIWADNDVKSAKYCPFEITSKFSKLRGGYVCDTEQFFLFKDGSPVTPRHVRTALRAVLKKLGLNHKLYNTHSFRIGRASDLMRNGMSIEHIKKVGRWRSNAVFKYIRD